MLHVGRLKCVEEIAERDAIFMRAYAARWRNACYTSDYCDVPVVSLVRGGHRILSNTTHEINTNLFAAQHHRSASIYCQHCPCPESPVHPSSSRRTTLRVVLVSTNDPCSPRVNIYFPALILTLSQYTLSRLI